MPTSIGNISFGGKNLSDADAAAAVARFAKADQEEKEYRAKLPEIRARGEAALRRLLPIAQNCSGQCRYVAAFLLGLYNGSRFPFDLTNLRAVDRAIVDDCIAVLQMDATPLKEVHLYFDDGASIFERLAQQWVIVDREKLHALIQASSFPEASYNALVRSDYLANGDR
jgi:hypothetical protein